ncbi:hypothetical protein ABH922_002566 [Rhodococcus sp. 27YEA15]|uniref:hypothetical protein n=1 Tax=Rhodococcus sp. 27YEA15 TaxID=3156259 RepID=UPI003C7980ED
MTRPDRSSTHLVSATEPSLAQSQPLSTRRELSLPGLILGAVVVVGAFGALAGGLVALAGHLSGIGPTYSDWFGQVGSDSALARAQWALGDITEPQFYKSWLASIGLLIGAALAWWAGTRKKRWAGTPISYGSGLWPWILGSSALSLVLSNLAFGWNLDEGWQPTFIPFVCVATSLVLVYGSGWPVFFTGAVMGAITTTPVAELLIAHVTEPLDLPSVVANTTAMSFGSALTFVVSRYLPWMHLPAPVAQSEPATAVTTIRGVPSLAKDAIWTVRRIITDFTETQFYANELASIGVIAGVTVAFVLNPLFPSFGTALLPHILFAQALTSAIGIVVWRRLYRGGGWAPTYISVVSVAPATVLAFGGSAVSILVGAVAGALLCPVIARPISSRLPKDFHPFIGNTISMAVATALVVTVAAHVPGI